MLRPRVIPVLLLKESGVVKTEGFKQPRYVGDPINALRVFNDKEVDEIVVLDIEATAEARGPNFERISDLASECFMPMAYGGGVRSAADAERLFTVGVEKVILGTTAVERPEIVQAVSSVAGAQSVVVCLDVRRNWRGRPTVWVRNGSKDTGRNPLELARELQQRGAGELILQSIDRDGTGRGYDLALIKEIAPQLRIPLVACGGAGSKEDLHAVLAAGAAGAAAGSLFVFFGKHRAVLISYLDNHEIMALR